MVVFLAPPPPECLPVSNLLISGLVKGVGTECVKATQTNRPVCKLIQRMVAIKAKQTDKGLLLSHRADPDELLGSSKTGAVG